MISTLTSALKHTCFSCIKQFRNIDAQSHSNPFKNQGGRISHAPLNTANVASVEATVGRKIFLGDTPLIAKPPQVPAYAFTNIHIGTLAIM